MLNSLKQCTLNIIDLFVQLTLTVLCMLLHATYLAFFNQQKLEWRLTSVDQIRTSKVLDHKVHFPLLQALTSSVAVIKKIEINIASKCYFR